MAGELAGRNVIVTGAGRGIGRAIALGCAEAGARVVVADYGVEFDGSAPDPAVAVSVAEEIASAGGEAIAVNANVASKAGADAIVAACLAAWGRIDGLVNCAGIVRHRPFLELTEADFDAVIAVHLKGHFLMFHAVLTAMVAQGGGGSLIGIGSGYVLGDANRAPYRTAKAGIIALTQSVALAGAEHGVRANVISPIASTRLTAASQLPIEAAPEDIAPLAVHLLSDSAMDVTGEVFSMFGKRIAVWGEAREQAEAVQAARWTPEQIAAAMPGLLAGRSTSPNPSPPVPDSARPQAEPEI
jgi:NAD(P)-dependent dehydrogenase (short-subunit alcohol dehydrogenase family)